MAGWEWEAMGGYLRPSELSEALGALGSGKPTVLAGGTDFYPARVERPLDDDVLDITGLRVLHGIADAGDHWRLGAGVTWTDVVEARLPPCFDGLAQAAREIGGVQIQNAGTVCGNVCNASPAADGMPNLLALDASVELASVDGRRVLPLADFVLGNRKTARQSNELATALLVPKPARPARSVFLKLGARRYLVISIVMVAAVGCAAYRVGSKRVWLLSMAQATARRRSPPPRKIIRNVISFRVRLLEIETVRKSQAKLNVCGVRRKTGPNIGDDGKLFA